MDILALTPNLHEGWDSLVRCSADGWVFSLAGWQRLILTVVEWRLEDRSFALAADGRLVGVMPLQYRPADRVMGSSGWGGSGPVAAGWLSPGQRRSVLKRLLAHAATLARDHDAEELSFSLSPVTQTSRDAPWQVNPFADDGFDDRSGLSRVIALARDETELWRDVSETARQAVRKARAVGCSVSPGGWAEELYDYYRLHEETYRRTGVTPHPRAYFEGIAKEFSGSEQFVLWVCRDGTGRPIAYHNTARFGEGAHYHTGCSAREALDNGANYLLFWEALLGMRERGVHWYDAGEVFPGASAGKQHGLSVFKTKFGGENHRLFRSARRLSKSPAEVIAPRPAAPGSGDVPTAWAATRRRLQAVAERAHVAGILKRALRRAGGAVQRRRKAFEP
jgi:GNAT acetyltransferase-like protein